MSSTETIDQARSDILLDFPLYLYLTNVRQLWSNIAAKLRGYKIDGLETDLDLLKKEVQALSTFAMVSVTHFHLFFCLRL